MKYKVGDKVKIKEGLGEGKNYGTDSHNLIVNVEMHPLCGASTTVKDVRTFEDGMGSYFLDIDKNNWNWNDAMLEDIVEDNGLLNQTDFDLPNKYKELSIYLLKEIKDIDIEKYIFLVKFIRVLRPDLKDVIS